VSSSARPDVDALVVGAGPAGVAAAIALRRAGREVVVIDKATFPRDKCCGDGLTTLALRELEHLGFEPATVPSFTTVDTVVLRSPSGRSVDVPLPRGQGLYAAVTPRVELDAALVDLATASGVKVHQGHGVAAVTGASDDGTSITVDVDGIGPITAGHVVAADGMWSPTRKHLGLHEDGYLGEWHAIRQYVSGVTGPARDRLIVWFDADFLPGYAWSFPLPDGRANVGFGILRRAGRPTKEMKAVWAAFFDRPHVAEALGPDATPENRHLAWPIPARVDKARLAHGRVLFVGDAAGATDVMTGEGIGQALLTGRLAAEAIVAGRDVAAQYTREVRRELVADHRMSVLLGRALSHRKGACSAIWVVEHSGAWGRRNFARWMFEDEPRAIVATPRRWHRKFLDRPGAYTAATPKSI
jgi:geranylgeranyl reductase family protein